ncbi:hypothetical protein CFD26_100546 [Aspergillus turcosus]|uniref:Trichothecene 3-O-acetyltransferase-like N-terminal domain-containing protein n=1 Tax=Aspergillus turcosus TaxID=1245748 RepID=A0A3R7IEJ6_9EURO|nr:hypothetical protein CFD26_100546 [Aspergillus turcosus]
MENYHDLDRYQDIFGQLRLLKSYTHFLLCFPIPDGSSTQSVLDALKAATDEVTSKFPWLMGKVINEGSGPGNSGLFKVARCARWEPPNSIFRVKDCTTVCPSFQEIVDARGPIRFFDPAVLAPSVAFPQSYQETQSDPAFVLALQANVVRGGLLLDLAGQHNIMSGGGMLQFLKLLAKVLCGDTISPFEIEQGNRDRRNMVKLLGPDEPLIDLSRFHRPSLLDSLVPAVPAPNGTWCTFGFTAEKLAELKLLASDAIQFVSPVTFISSNDALTAFFWKAITRVRLRLGRVDDRQATRSKFVRAVDVRSTMGVPNEYMGHMVYNTFSTLTFAEVDSFSLAKLASVMRKNLIDDVNEYAVCSFVTLLDRTPDKTTIMYGGEMNRDTDVAFTSIAQSDLYHLEFGVLGKLALFRRPNFIPRATTAIMFPKTREGYQDFQVCLQEEDLRELKQDSEWMSYAEIIDRD